jgi:cullin-4
MLTFRPICPPPHTYSPPSPPTHPPTPTQELQQLQADFSERYKRQYKEGRQLVWQHALATCTVRASFPKGPRELQVSLLQAVVLGLFNGADTLSYEDIAGALGIQGAEAARELKRTLLSLSVGKVSPLGGWRRAACGQAQLGAA